MKRPEPRILTINGGSSSIKFALFAASGAWQPILSGELERIGTARANLKVRGLNPEDDLSKPVRAANATAAADALIEWIEEHIGQATLAAVGHRVVHGGPKYFAAQLVTDEMVEDLHRFSPFDPEHLPLEIELLKAFRQRHPHLPQVACFDTAFHRAMPRVATLLPIPRRYEAQGVRRYGFHGLSYEFLMAELVRLGDPAASKGRVILAHLGNGASLAAVRDGKSIDTSMGFTPTAGLVMGTRTGDLDPGLISYLVRTAQMSTAHFQKMVTHESGLLGISETSADMRDLLARENTDVRAAEAVALFCYQAKKWVGAFAAALGGLDTLVFAGGIGENAPPVRERICDGLGFLGITIDTQRNAKSAPMISPETAPVKVRVIRTDEALMIAKASASLLNLGAIATP